jgi:hypothetical protein
MEKQEEKNEFSPLVRIQGSSSAMAEN